MPSEIRIAFFGSSLVSAFWNGAATYYRGITRALAERGHRITFFEPDAFGRQQHREGPDPDWAEVVVYPADERGVAQALNSARNMDLIVKCSGVGVFDELLESAALELKNSANFVMFWDVDAPATLDRVRANGRDPFRRLIPQYDLIFTYGGGTPVVSAYRSLDARDCVPIYNALDPSTHFPVAPEAKYEGDLTFVGNRLPDRESRVEEFFLKPAGMLPEKRFVLGGSGWETKALPSNVNYVGHVYTTGHNAFNCTPGAVLNVNRDSMASYGFSPPT